MFPNPMNLPEDITEHLVPQSDDHETQKPSRMTKGRPAKTAQVLNAGDFLEQDENGRFKNAYEIDASE